MTHCFVAWNAEWREEWLPDGIAQGGGNDLFDISHPEEL